MPRPMARAQFAKPNQCQACMITFSPDTEVILAGDTRVCATHASLIVADQVTFRGRWSERPRN